MIYLKIDLDMVVGTLSYLKNKNHCLSIGLAYDEQINERIPSEKFDQKLDIIITQSMIIN